MGNNAFVQVLKIKPFRNLWLSQLISQTALNLLFFSLMLRVYDLTRSNSAVSLMVLVVTIPNILLGALAGVLVDRGDRKMVMFLSHFLRVFAVLAFLISAETIGWLYFLAFAISIISQFFFPAEAATIHEVVKEKKLLLTANSLFSVTFFATVILGNVLAGPFLILFGTLKTFVLVASAFLLASIFTASLPGEKISSWVALAMRDGVWHRYLTKGRQMSAGILFSELLTGFDHIYKTKIVARAIILLGVSQTTIGVLGAIAPGFADRILKIPVTSVSVLVMAPAAAGMILGAGIVGGFLAKVKRSKLAGWGIVSVSLGLFLFSLVDVVARVIGIAPFQLGILFLLLLGGANAMVDIPANTMIQENTPEEIRSRVYGVLNSFVGAGAILPIVLAGVAADIFGVRGVMMLVCVALLGFVLYNHFYVADSS